MVGIVAISKNGVIGNNNSLPWVKNSEDLKFFRQITNGKRVVFGSTTFKTLPKLPNREVYVLTTKLWNKMGLEIIENEFGCRGRKIDVDYVLATDIPEDPFIICGGAKVYETFFPHIKEFYVTHLDVVCDGDTRVAQWESWFPNKKIIKSIDGGYIAWYSKNV